MVAYRASLQWALVQTQRAAWLPADWPHSRADGPLETPHVGWVCVPGVGIHKLKTGRFPVSNDQGFQYLAMCV